MHQLEGQAGRCRRQGRPHERTSFHGDPDRTLAILLAVVKQLFQLRNELVGGKVWHPACVQPPGVIGGFLAAVAALVLRLSKGLNERWLTGRHTTGWLSNTQEPTTTTSSRSKQPPPEPAFRLLCRSTTKPVSGGSQGKRGETDTGSQLCKTPVSVSNLAFKSTGDFSQT